MDPFNGEWKKPEDLTLSRRSTDLTSVYYNVIVFKKKKKFEIDDPIDSVFDLSVPLRVVLKNMGNMGRRVIMSHTTRNRTYKEAQGIQRQPLPTLEYEINLQGGDFVHQFKRACEAQLKFDIQNKLKPLSQVLKERAVFKQS